MNDGTQSAGSLDPDQAHLQQRLQDAGLICGRVAHAFDNILTGILGFAELSLSQLDPSAPVYAYVEEVIRAAQQGVDMTQQLHLFGRGAAVSPGPANVGQVAAEEAAGLESRPGKGKLVFELPDGLPAVAVDSELLRHVLGHLLSNAREAVSQDGVVKLSARVSELDAQHAATLVGRASAGSFVEVTVSDSGGQLSPEVQRRLFYEPFFTTKPRHRGLGLAIVYRIVAAHGGGLQVNPSEHGETVVRVFLPVAAAPARATERGNQR